MKCCVYKKKEIIYSGFFLEYDAYKNGDCLSEHTGMLTVCKNIFYKIDILSLVILIFENL